MCVCLTLGTVICIVTSGLHCRLSDIFTSIKLLRTRNAYHPGKSRSSADAVAVSIFVSLPLLLWAFLRSAVSLHVFVLITVVVKF